MKKIALALAVALIAFAPLSADAKSKTRTRTKIVGYSASASWEYTQGDIGTFVSVVVTDNDVSGTGGPSEDAFVSLAISQFQISTGNVLITGTAEIDGPQNFSFDVDNQLRSARLQVHDAIFQDDSTFTFFNVDLDLTWTGTEELVTSKSHERIKNPGFRFRSEFRGVFRDGVATGSVFGKNIQFTPIASSNAQLQHNRFGSIEVVTETP